MKWTVRRHRIERLIARFRTDPRPGRGADFRWEFEELEPRLAPAVDVLSYHGDNASDGENLAETALTPALVNYTTFGKLYSTPLDGQAYAQPLLKTGVNVTVGPVPGLRDVAYVATQNDSLYAIDANDGQVLWADSFINPAAGVTTVAATTVNSTNIQPQIGITGTPVIDPAGNAIYLVAFTQEVRNGQTHFVQRLHAIDLGSGAEQFGGPAVIGDTAWDGTNYTYASGPSVAGTGDGSVNGVVDFNALRALQRAALTLSNGVVYVAFASHEDNGPYHGWVLGYNAQTLALTAVFNDTPNGSDGGIWQSGGKVAVDAQGYLYIVTGNGSFDTALDAQGLPSLGDYGDSAVKLAVDPASTAANPNVNGWGLKVVDYFTPFNQANLQQYDNDLGSGGPLVLPDSVGSAAHPHLMVLAGKEGTIYLIDRDNMGKFDPTRDNVAQVLYNQLIHSSFDTPAYFNNTVYYVGAKNLDKAQTFSISNGLLSTASTSQSLETFSYPGSTPTVTANGSSNGIVWDLDTYAGSLKVYNAASYAQLLYTTDQAPNGRDTLGAGVKYAVPTVANGRAYVGSSAALTVYGLLLPPSAPPAAPSGLSATPVSSAQIALNWKDDPNNYGANEMGIDVEESTDGTHFSLVATAAAHATSIAVGGLSPSTSYAFRIRARNGVGPSGYSNSASATTLPAVGPGGIDFSSGFAGAGAALTRNGSAAVVGSALRLTDGGSGEAGSAYAAGTVNVAQFTNRFSFQLTNPSADGFTFVIQGTGPTALGMGGGGLGYGAGWQGGPGGIPASAAVKFDLYNSDGEGGDSTGLYLNGAAPTSTGSTDLTGAGIDLHSGHVFAALMNYDGSTLTATLTDTVTGASATQSYAVNVPAAVGGGTAYVGFTGGTGGLTATQDVLSWTYVPTALPKGPTNLTATPASGSEIDLAWTNAANNQTGFKVERSADGTTFVPIGTSVGTSYADAGLTGGTQYYYRVRATNAGGDSAPSNAVAATTPVPPVTPSGAQATLVAANEVDLAWIDNANNETGYRVYREVSGGTFSLIATLAANSQSYKDMLVTSGTRYDYHISAYNLAGSSDFTGLTVTTLSPTGSLNFSSGFASSGGLVRLNGAAKLAGNALRLTDGGGGEAASAFSAGTLGVNAFSTAFQFQLANANADGLAFVIQGTGPTALGMGGGGLGYGAGWQGGPGGIPAGVAVKFDLYNNQGEGADSTGLYLNGAAPLGGGSLDLTSTGVNLHSGHPINAAISYSGTSLAVVLTDAVTGATATQAYAVNVAAQVGGPTAYVGFTASTGGLTATQDVLSWTYTPAPAAPTNPTASAGTGQVTARWSSALAATGYNVYRGTTPGGEGATPYVSNYASTSYTDTAVTAGTAYYYQASAVNSAGESAKSAEVSAIPAGLNFSSGFASSGGLVRLNGAAKLAGNALRLTDGGGGEAASAFSAGTLGVNAFSTAFQFQLANANADGLAFVIQGTGPAALGMGGGGLGYGAGWQGGPGGIPAGVAVKFDLYNNQGEGADSTGLYLNGAAPLGGGSLDLTSTGVNLHSGHPINAAISYSGTSLAVVLTDAVTGATATQAYAVNVAAQVGGPTAYVGFTASTGGLTATQDVLSWTYTPAPAAPTSPTALGGVGQVALAWANSAGASTYDVYRGTTPGGEGAVPYATNLLSNSYVDTGVTSGATYYYQVSAANVAGESARTAEVSGGPTDLNFSAGFAAAGPALTLNGVAGVSKAAINGTAMRLTSGLSNEATSAFAASAVAVTKFTTQFNFQLSGAQGEGFAFVVAGGGPAGLGTSGAGLGYGASGTGGIPNSSAVKFDLNGNQGEGNDSTGLFLNGALPTNPGSIDLTSTGIDLRSGHVLNATIAYDGTTLKVTITDTVTNAKAVQSYAVNLASVVGGSKAYVGFTASTGTLVAVQDILEWSFTPLV